MFAQQFLELTGLVYEYLELHRNIDIYARGHGSQDSFT